MVLRRYDTGDVGSLDALITANLDHLAPFMSWIALEPVSKVERRRLIASWNEEADHGLGVILGCFHNGKLIGSSGLHRRRPDPSSLEVGYWLASEATGQGYATALTLLLVDEALTHDDISVVDLYCDDDNAASAAVAERAGFRFLGTADAPDPSFARLSGRERRSQISRANADPTWRSRF